MADPLDDFFKMMNEIMKDVNKDNIILEPKSKFATGGQVVPPPFLFAQFAGLPVYSHRVARLELTQLANKTAGLTDDEKIDYYLSRKILKEFGVEI